MARTCSVCNHPQVDQINLECIEGRGSAEIAGRYGIAKPVMDHHRTAGHASRAVTRAILDTQATTLPEFAAVAITNKLYRLQELDWLYRRVKAEIEAKQVGELDPQLIRSAESVLRTSQQALGQWTPDGGAEANATRQLAQSIVIHAAITGGVADQLPKTIQPPSDES